MRRSWVGIYFTLSLVLLAVRLFIPARSLTATGAIALLDTSFALVLWLLVLALSVCWGTIVLRCVVGDRLDGLERLLFAFPLGLGVIAYGILALGLLGHMQPVALVLWLLLLSAFSIPAWPHVFAPIASRLKRVRPAWRALDGWERIFLLVAGAIAILTFLQALTPTWDYDGLLYHLQVPRLYLEAGRIYPVADNWLAFYPATVEMLMALGIAFGADQLGKLVQFASGIVLVLATFAWGRRFLGRPQAWLAAALLLGIPILQGWSSISYIDVTWALFEFMAFYAVLVWLRERRSRWLVLAGLFMGLAIGSKYLALGGGLALGLWLLWYGRTDGWRRMLSNALIFGGVALFVGSPWYLKNWFWSGNPVYPLLFTPQDWSPQRVDLWLAYMDSFGAGKRWIDYLLLPVNLYTQFYRFGTFWSSIEIPNFLFWVLALFPWTKKTASLKALFWLALGRFILWALGTQQTRYLLPVFPLVSLLCAQVLVQIPQWLRRGNLGRVLVRGLTLGMVVVTLTYGVLLFSMVKPLHVIAGFESQDSFLERLVGDYAAMRFIMNELPPDARVYMLWDGRAYYCDQRCLPDVDHMRWTQLVSEAGDITTTALDLQELGVTHLLFSNGEFNFILAHDQGNLHQQAADFFTEFQVDCTYEVYRDNQVAIYRLTCP